MAVETDELPAWSLPAGAATRIEVPDGWPRQVTREWAWGGSTGAGVRVCIVDSGVELDHPLVGSVERSVAVESLDGDLAVRDDESGDVAGHGTACAGVIRSLAPDSRLTSVRVLGPGFTGSGPALLAGLEWAVEHDFDVINLSLSTTRSQFAQRLHELADAAYFKRTMIVASAHNMPVESFPWRFASVVSVGSHEEADPFAFYYNQSPPVEFFARGLEVRVPWVGGRTVTSTGNSFATPHISGICALVLAAHPGLTPFQLKSILYLTASNVGGAR